ncbi:MAG TPA: hypothetical protein VE777_01260 [Gaiellales bacterium]|jgi:hypothetical protein|nr:hypothetical protein [Gaiellales bacterium]
MFCGKCRSPRAAGDRFCPRCGAAYPAEPPAAQAPAAAGATPPHSDDASNPPYGSEMTLGAWLLTIFMPFIALVAALLLRGSESRPRRRPFLRTRAVASAAWLCTGWVLGLIVVFSLASTSVGGGCQGGPDPVGVPLEFTSSDNRHWTATVPCVNGGTTTRPARPGEVPGP